MLWCGAPADGPPTPYEHPCKRGKSFVRYQLLFPLKQKIFNNAMDQNVLRQEQSDDHELVSSVCCRCQTNRAGGGISFSTPLLLLLLSWRGVPSEVRGRKRCSQRPKAKKDPIYLFNVTNVDIKRRGRVKLSCIWSASYD